MKLFFLPLGTLLLLALLAFSQPKDEWTLLVGGSIEGYLSPCGCTKPMTGGIRRKITAFNTQGPRDRTTRIELGPLAGGVGRQEEIKLETAVEALASGPVQAISGSFEEARMGTAMLANLSRTAKGRLVSSGVTSEHLQPSLAHGPFLIGSWDPKSSQTADLIGATAMTAEEAVGRLTSEAESRGLQPVLLLEEGRQAARQMAERHPSLAVIAYRSKSNPPSKAERVGRTLLVTPGPQGKAMVRLVFKGSSLADESVISLGPEFKDDPEAARIFRVYKKRLKEEKLLEGLPRTDGPKFAGSRACVSCHSAAASVWKKSSHASALKTLEEDGSDSDPECVSCHVVGLDKKAGFRSRTATPHLADVGCESCHGPGAAHAASPKKVNMPSSFKNCLTCHNPDHSPKFDEKAYWKKIAH